METRISAREIQRADLLKEREMQKFSIARYIEMTLAALSLFLISPAMVILAVFIRLTSRGPVIYKYMEPGIHGTRYFAYKFRTTYVSRPEEKGNRLPGNTTVTLRHPASQQSKLTPIGKYLRLTGLDTSPQLFNLLRGDISVQGCYRYAPIPMPEEGIS